MLQASKVISTAIDLKVRFIKFLRFGKSDVQEVREAMPFGLDSNPPKDMIAIYGETSEKGKGVVIGYINRNAVADVGEIKIYSTNENQEEQMYIHLKNDGTAEFGGTGDFLVRFNELETGYNQLKTDFNSLVSLYNGHFHPFVGLAVGVPGTTAPTAATGTASTASIAGAKISEFKTFT